MNTPSCRPDAGLSASRELALFSPSLRAGGAEKVMVTLANGLAERGIRVTLLLASAEGEFLTQVDPAVRIVDLKAKRVAASLFALARFLRRHRPLALLSFQTHANLIAMAARGIARVPVRIVASERSSFTGSQAALGLKSRLVRSLGRLLYRKADAVVVVSEAMVNEIRAAPGIIPERVVFIPNPIVSPALLRLAEEPLDHPFARPGGPPLVMAAGRLAGEKDFSTLLRAFALVRRRMEAKLLILGEGPDRSALEALVDELKLRDDVDLPGFRANPWPYMKAASVFVLSSRYEGLPGALIQAMAVGTPVVSTDCRTGPGEILERGRWGKLVPVGDADALAAAVVDTLTAASAPDVARRAEFYSLDRALAGYLAVLDPTGKIH
ncbi:MAG: glycosyltransferase [Tsuneonella sp.]